MTREQSWPVPTSDDSVAMLVLTIDQGYEVPNGSRETDLFF